MTDWLLAGTLAFAFIAALFAFLTFLSARAKTSLGRQDVMELLRFEGDAIRAAGEQNARSLRQEIGQTLAQNHKGALDVVTSLSDSLLRQIDAFGQRLGASNRTTEERIDGIGEKLNADIAQMGESADSNREALRALIEQKLEAATGRQSEAATRLREELNTIIASLAGSLLTQIDSFGQRLAASNRTTEERIDGIGEKLNADIAQMGESADANRDALRALIEQKLAASATAQSEAAFRMREELNASFQRMRALVSETLTEASNYQKERLDGAKKAIDDLSTKQATSSEQLRLTVESRLDLLRNENALELEKVRATVDEKLQTTLEKRLDESFARVVEHLNKAYEVFGELRTISASVGDLKNVLTNPKLRGTFGEVQLAMLLQDFLSPSQYIKDAQVKDGSAERVEFAIRLPMSDGQEILLPVDAKFPREDHEHMIAAYEAGDMELAEHFRKQLENRIKSFAKDISRKYINPPRTSERAILFLPTESLFAEVLRQPGLFDYLHRECNVMLAGPTTFAAILHSFQVNHRSMAIAQQSGEVWKILSAVRTEFKKYNDTVGRVAKQLKTATSSVEDLDKRTRLMDRALRSVETMPDDGSAAKLLGLGTALVADDEMALLPLAPLSEIVVSEDEAA